MAIQLTEFRRGVISLFGSFLIHLILGSFYLWGSINIYVASYYRINYEPDLSIDSCSAVFPLMAVACNIVTPISLKVCEKIGLKLHCFLFSVIIGACVFASSYMTSFWLFVLLYGIGYGFGSGMIYLIPMYNSYKYFPTKRGLVSGIIMGAYGLGSVISSNILLKIVNPDNVKADVIVGSDHYFKKEVADHIPKALRILAIYFFVLLMIGCVCIMEFPMTAEEEAEEESNSMAEKIDEEEEENPHELVLKVVHDSDNDEHSVNPSQKEKNPLSEKLIASKAAEIAKKKSMKLSKGNNSMAGILKSRGSMFHSSIAKWSHRTINPTDEKECPDLAHAMKSLPFYIILGMLFFSASNGYYLASNYKNYGVTIPEIDDDSYLTLVGSLSSISNGGGRLFWGLILDRSQFKKVYAVLLIFQMILIATLQLIAKYKVSYLFWICFCLLCEGGHFVLFPPLAMKVFGTKVGATVYSLMMIGFCCSNLSQFGITMAAKPSIGYENEFWIFFSFTAISLFLLFAFKLKYIHKN